ncbi:MAG TPA: nicotinamide riboside transporter PnuC [Bacteroidales bacterium]|nr:nicotinamide riboside transporter PnuC [Bacteroidales bacterium]
MEFPLWLTNNYLEVFGAVTGIIFVLLEIRQNIWLWPLGILTSGTYIWVFFTNKFYADMSLQGYYLAISILGWYWWTRHREGDEDRHELVVTRLKFRTGAYIAIAFILMFAGLWFVLEKFTDSPVPIYDSFITSLSIVATWMLARKIFEHWYLWIIVNGVSAIVFLSRGLIPTLVLYTVYCIMSFAGIIEWKKSLINRKVQ